MARCHYSTITSGYTTNAHEQYELDLSQTKLSNGYANVLVKIKIALKRHLLPELENYLGMTYKEQF